MNLVEIEGIVAWHGTVEARLKEGGPLGVETSRAAEIILADTGHSGEHGLATVHVFHGTWSYLSSTYVNDGMDQLLILRKGSTLKVDPNLIVFNCWQIQ